RGRPPRHAARLPGKLLPAPTAALARPGPGLGGRWRRPATDLGRGPHPSDGRVSARRRRGGGVESQERLAPRRVEVGAGGRAGRTGQVGAAPRRPTGGATEPTRLGEAASAPLPPLRLQLLGEFRVWVGDREVA